MNYNSFKEDPLILDLDSHYELRNKFKGKPKKRRLKKITEKVLDTPTEILQTAKLARHNNSNLPVIKSDVEGKPDYHELHDHESVKPIDITDEQKEAITGYTSKEAVHPGASKNINNYLKNRFAGNNMGHVFKQERGIATNAIDETTGKTIDLKNNTPENVLKASEILLSCFTPKNMIKRQIDCFSGISTRQGQSISRKKPGITTFLPSFVSTSTDLDVATDFADDQASDTDSLISYIIHFICEPGSAISLVHHSTFQENEILLPVGAKVQYLGKTKEVAIQGEDESYTNLEGTPTTYNVYFIFKVFPIKDAKPLSKFGPYHQPEGIII